MIYLGVVLCDICEVLSQDSLRKTAALVNQIYQPRKSVCRRIGLREANQLLDTRNDCDEERKARIRSFLLIEYGDQVDRLVRNWGKCDLNCEVLFSFIIKMDFSFNRNN